MTNDKDLIETFTEHVIPKSRPAPDIQYEQITRGEVIPEILFDLLSIKVDQGDEDVHHKQIKAYLKHKKLNFVTDEQGNLRCWVRTEEVPSPTTMFSCHLDTVHHGEPTELDLWVTVGPFDHNKDFIYASEKDTKDGSIIGADDTIGAYIMIHLIENDVPGLYVFHMGEESGGMGSHWLAENHPKMFKNIERCVAFDRMNYGDIINRQSGGVCCSSQFVDALAKTLNENLQYLFPSQLVTFKSATGSYTDSASYTEIIPECTNLSIGYFHQHSSGEHFDYWWLNTVLLHLYTAVDWEALPTHREAKPKPVITTYSHDYGNTSSGTYYNGVYQPNANTVSWTTTWEPQYALPATWLVETAKKEIKKWSRKSMLIIEDQIIALLKLLEDAQEEKEEIVTEIDAAIAHVNELKEYVKTRYKEDYVIEQLETLSNSLVDIGLDLATITIQKELPEEDVKKVEAQEMKELEEEEKKKTNSSVSKSKCGIYKQTLADTQFPVASPTTAARIRQNMTFDPKTRTAWFKGTKKCVLFGKRGNEFSAKALDKLSIGTQLYIKYEGEFIWIHTVEFADFHFIKHHGCNFNV